MTAILLDDWARKHKIELRTAQRWANKGLIGATKKRVDVTVRTKVTKYLVDEETMPPF